VDAQASTAYNAGMQYTLRDVPETMDAELRRRAAAERKSLNRVAVEVLAEGLGLCQTTRRRRDLSDIAGSWHKDKATEAALAAQDRIDPDLWK